MNYKEKIVCPIILSSAVFAFSANALAQQTPRHSTNCPYPPSHSHSAAGQLPRHHHIRPAHRAQSDQAKAELARRQQLALAQQKLDEAIARYQAEHDRLSLLESENQRLAFENARHAREAQEATLRERLALEQETIAKARLNAVRPPTARGGGPTNWHPTFRVGLEGGAAAFTEDFDFDKGVGSATHAGPAWGLRGGVDILPWFGVEARYLGFYNEGIGETTVGGKLLTSAGLATARFIAPIRYAQPYVFTGIGLYSTNVLGSNAERQATNLRSNVSGGIPIGIGVNVPVHQHVSVGLETVYHRLFSESFDKVEAISGGDPVTFNGFVNFIL